MARRSRSRAAQGILFGMLVLGSLGTERGDAVVVRVNDILEARILHLQYRPHPDRESSPDWHYMAVAIERTVSGKELSGTAIVRVNVRSRRHGVLLWGEKERPARGEPVRIPDPGYWAEGAKISIGSWSRCPDSRLEGLEPDEEARTRFGDEEFRSWLASPLLCVNESNLFLLDERGFVIDAPPFDDENDWHY